MSQARSIGGDWLRLAANGIKDGADWRGLVEFSISN